MVRIQGINSSSLMSVNDVARHLLKTCNSLKFLNVLCLVRRFWGLALITIFWL